VKKLAEDYHLPIGLHLLENAAEKNSLKKSSEKALSLF